MAATKKNNRIHLWMHRHICMHIFAALHKHWSLCDVCTAAAVQMVGLYISIPKSNNIHHLMLWIVCKLSFFLALHHLCAVRHRSRSFSIAHSPSHCRTHYTSFTVFSLNLPSSVCLGAVGYSIYLYILNLNNRTDHINN